VLAEMLKTMMREAAGWEPHLADLLSTRADQDLVEGKWLSSGIERAPGPIRRSKVCTISRFLTATNWLDVGWTGARCFNGPFGLSGLASCKSPGAEELLKPATFCISGFLTNLKI